MANVISNTTYKNYQIIIEEPISGKFTYEVNDPILIKTLGYARGFFNQADALNAAEAAVNALPESTAVTAMQTVLTNAGVSSVTTDDLVLAVRNAGVVFMNGRTPQPDPNNLWPLGQSAKYIDNVYEYGVDEDCY